MLALQNISYEIAQLICTSAANGADFRGKNVAQPASARAVVPRIAFTPVLKI